MQQFVGNNCVVHAHAALIEDAHDRLLTSQAVSERFADLLRTLRKLGALQSMNMAAVMNNPFASEPASQSIDKKVVGEVTAPKRAVFDAGLGQRSVQIQHSNQAGPLPA